MPCSELYLTCAFALILWYSETTNVVSMERFQTTLAQSQENFSPVKSFADVPAYMLQLYNRTANEDGTIKTKENRIPRIVRSYLTTGSTAKDILFFNVTGTPVNEGLWKATINLFKRSTPKTRSSPFQATVTALDLSTAKRMSRQTVSSPWEGWVALDVTSLVIRWLQQPDSNEGVQIKIENQNNCALETLKFEYDWKNTTYGPLLVLFEDSISNSAIARTSPASRSVRSTKRCSRVDMTVKFNTVSWYTVFLPSSFNAYRCHGDCDHPLSFTSKPTNHAIVQAQLAASNSSIKRPCCVPTKLGRIFVVYYDGSGRFIQKVFDGMTVQECGCN